MKTKTIELKPRKYPICPECGEDTLVGFVPPKDGMSFLNDGNNAIDWDKSHLYCCNGDSNCKYNTKFKDLTTPRDK